MAPPYKLIDVATGQVVQTDGQSWDNMDTQPGNTIEVYSGTVTGGPNARISPGEIIRPPNTDPDPGPGPDPTPPSGADMDYPLNETQLAQFLQSYANNGIIGQLDPRTKVTVTKTITIKQSNNGAGSPWGVDGNGAKITWGGAAGQDMLQYVGVQGVNNRGLTVRGLFMDGNGYAGGAAGACLKLSAPLGDSGPIYEFLIEDVYTVYATNGLFLEGGVYEGMCLNVHAQNHNADGIFMQNLSNGAVVSNVSLLHPNCSRNFGAGIHSVYSCDIKFGSFVLNALGGVVAPAGLRSASQCNGENTGEAVFVVGSKGGYGCAISSCEASSDGQTVCRKFQNGVWVSLGKPELYLINWSDGSGTGTVQQMNHCSYYGSGTNPMRVVK